MRLALALLMLPLSGFSQQPTEPSDPLVVVDSAATTLEVPDKEVSSEEDRKLMTLNRLRRFQKISQSHFLMIFNPKKINFTATRNKGIANEKPDR